MARDNEFEWSQFCRLGEMIGDGLHHEDKWISKEYNRLAKILIPEAFTEQNKIKNDKRNDAISKKLLVDRCGKCGSEMKQTRSGSFIVKCTKCGAKFKYNVLKK